MANGIGAERRANSALLEIFDGGRKRAGAKSEREIVGALLTEVTFDHAVIFDFALDDRSGLDDLV